MSLDVTQYIVIWVIKIW